MDYLEAMELWWSELDGHDRERVYDLARMLRDAQRAAVRGPNG